jgi:DNA invertase Pin-like site-specific DNA recombinase
MKEMFREFWDEVNYDKRFRFITFGDINKGQYTDKQKNYAFELISKSGIRATARTLKTPRRTLQRWCKKYHIRVKRCPDWVYSWAERRRKHKLFWQRRGYF